MGHYFEDFRSIGARSSGEVRGALRTVAGRYMGENPPTPPLFRIDSELGIHRLADYRYIFDLGTRFPDAPDFSVAYAWGALYAEAGRSAPFSVSIGGPLKVYLNGELVFKSHIGHERTADQKHPFEAKLQAGWNNFVLEFTKTPRGFGGVFGTGNKKSSAFHFICPSAETSSWAGWLFSRPQSSPLARLPAYGESEADTGIDWLPRRSWTPEELGRGVYGRLFGIQEGLYARSWTKGDFRHRGEGEGEYRFRGRREGAFRLWVDGKELFSAEGSGDFDFTSAVAYGIRDTIVESRCEGSSWGFELEILGAQGELSLSLPVTIPGCADAYLHSGPFAGPLPELAQDCSDLRRLSRTVIGPSYFRLDKPGAFIRPFVEGGNFGQWHYPLGVNLYGLLVAGRVLESADIEAYAQSHLQLVSDWYEYALWDGSFYGAASILHHLFQMDCLDDCGSAGAATLEAALRVGLEGFRPLVDDIAAYIEDGQERLGDRAFYRNRPENPFMAGTIWSDDLYMSVPFLCRYWRLSGDERYLDDAVRQYRLYREYLLIPGADVMSHVYDVSARLANGVPWGRGNGWALFSLAELLTVLPESHAARDELLDFFRLLCGGVLRLQDGEGMWHQILTDPESYPETSCTAMFLYAFARGLKIGFISDSAYDEAARKAWRALCSNSIDDKGNVYGVCRGSGFSFTESYYKDELSWNFNDIHGIGIILLAGAEFLDLEKSRSPWSS